MTNSKHFNINKIFQEKFKWHENEYNFFSELWISVNFLSCSRCLEDYGAFALDVFSAREEISKWRWHGY